MKLIETDNGLAVKFACQKCGQSLELLAEPRLFDCPACSQSYRLRTADGEIIVKAISDSTIQVEPTYKVSGKSNSGSKTKLRFDNSAKSNIGSTRRRRKTSSSLSTLVIFLVIITSVSGGGMWLKSLEKGKVAKVTSSQQIEKSPVATISAEEMDSIFEQSMAEKTPSVTVSTPTKSQASFSDGMDDMASMLEQETTAKPISVTASAPTGHILFDQVKVIFEESCVGCHGAKRQKGKFRMDTLEGVLKGGSSGEPALIKGNAKESLLYKLISLHANDDDIMPSDGEPLSMNKQSIVKDWINSGAPWKGTLVPREKPKVVAIKLTDSPFAKVKSVDLTNSKYQALASQYIDALIDKDLRDRRQRPSAIISDENFLRRAYLDIAGRIPTLQEYDSFFSFGKSDRHKLVNELMDSPGFLSHSHNYWLDALRVKERVAKNTLETYNNWIQQSIKENMPYDEFAYKLVASEGAYGDPMNASVGYYLRDDLTGFMAEDSLSNTMQLFLATDILCAQCHDHPYKKWTQKDFYKLLAFTNGTNVNGRAHNHRETGAMLKVLKPKSTPEKNGLRGYYKTIQAGVFKGGSGTINLPPDYQYEDGKPNEMIRAQVPFGEPLRIDFEQTQPSRKYNNVNLAMKGGDNDYRARMHLAKWMTSPENPMFTKTIVNRLWGRVFGSPLVGKNLDMAEEDMGDNPKLTTFLIKLMKLAKYDQKVFMKILFKTKSYQRTALEVVEGKFYHPAPAVRRLTAEQVWDSLLSIREKNPDIGVGEGKYTKYNLIYKEMVNMSPAERIDFMQNRDKRLKDAKGKYEALPGVKLSSKSHRASMMRPGRASFLNIYGMSGRALIDGAIQDSTIPQALHLMNNDLYLGSKKHGRSTSYLYDRLKDKSASAEMKIKHIYNAILSRNPSRTEINMAKSHLVNSKDLDQETLAWALTNSHEFKIKR